MAEAVAVPGPAEQTSASGRPQDRGASGSWWVLVLACTAWFMVVLDESVVNVALPSIRSDLGFDPVSVQWVANAYALAFAGLLLLGGRVADLYGCKPVLLVGLAVFTAASLVGGAALGPVMLVAARGAQGLGSAIVAPVTLTLLTSTFPEGPRRTRALTIWGAVGSVAGASGNLLGGVLTQTVSWRAILLINLPLGLGAIGLATRYLTGHGRPRRRRLDLPGAMLATMAVVSLTYAVTRASSSGWHDPVMITALSLAIAGLAAFVLVETRLVAEPLIPLRLLRTRTIGLGNAITLLAGACFQIPMWYFLSFAIQQVLEYTPLETGLAFLPYTVLGLGIGMRLTPWLMSHFPNRGLIAIGAVIIAAAFMWQSRISPDGSYMTAILGPAIVSTAGSMLFFTPLTSVVTSGISAADAGAASGLMNTAKQIGGVLGLAAMVTATGQGSGVMGYAYSHAFVIMAMILVVAAGLALALPPAVAPGQPEPTDR